MKIKLIEDKKRCEKKLQKNNRLFSINKISNIICQKRVYKNFSKIKIKSKIKEENNINKNKKKNIIINDNRIISFSLKLLMIINIFSQVKDDIFKFYYIQYSNISLKIKGIGKSNILGINNLK